MSLIVALKYKGKIYIGSDSLAIKDDTKYYLINANNRRIFPVKGCSNMLMALSGRLIESNIARCLELVPDAVALKGNVDFEFMVTKFVPKLFDAFNNRNLLNTHDDGYYCDSDMIVAYKNQMFEIFSDGTVLECDDYAVIGCGGDEVLGSLMSTNNIDDPKKRIVLALKAGLRDNNRVAYPIIVTDTETCEFEVICE